MKLYRYFDYPDEDGMKVICKEYEVISETERGYWFLDPWYRRINEKRFVLKDSRKRFCHADKQQALESYKARKHRQIKILTSRLKCAKLALESANNNCEKQYDSLTLT